MAIFLSSMSKYEICYVQLVTSVEQKKIMSPTGVESITFRKPVGHSNH